MIVTRIMGGLGNQMFQYAFGAVVAKHLETSLLIDISWFNKQTTDTHRDFSLRYFQIPLNEISDLNIQRMKRLYGYPFYLLPNKIQSLIRLISKSRIIQEHSLDLLNIDSLSKSKNYYCSGYWQHGYYFHFDERFVRQLFKFPKPKPIVSQWIDHVKTCSSPISLHVRRGDYVTNQKTAAYHGVLPTSYYLDAISYFSSIEKVPEYYVFSDDLQWTKAHLPKGHTYHFVQHDSTDHDDIRLMSLCKHHIIANSSFSWWGAWLNPLKDKVVIAPRQWFKNSMCSETRLPKTWITL